MEKYGVVDPRYTNPDPSADADSVKQAAEQSPAQLADDGCARLAGRVVAEIAPLVIDVTDGLRSQH